MLGSCVFTCEVEIDFEAWENIAVDLYGDLGFVGLRISSGAGLVDQGAQMVSPQIDFVGESWTPAGRDAIGIGLRDFPKDFVTAGVFNLETQISGGGLVTGTVERKRADMNGLARLVYRLFSGQEDGGFWTRE